MDLFEYASISQTMGLEQLWLQLLVGGLCFIVVFVFQAVALFIIARREGYKNKWMAFLPFFNTYYIGVCAQKNGFYSINAKKIGIVAAVMESVLFVTFVLYYVCAAYVTSHGWLVVVKEQTTIFGDTVATYGYNGPVNYAWMGWISLYLYEYILRWVDLLYVLVQAALLVCFFQTYAANRYFLFTITSILFPIQGILFFVVRNNRAMNYREYIRKQQERQYRMYQQQQQQNFQNNPYNQNPYGNNRTYTPPEPPENAEGNRTDGGNANGGHNDDDPFGGLGAGGGNPPQDPFDGVGN